MDSTVDGLYREFFNFCSGLLKKESPIFMKCIEQRYDECDEHFRKSQAMVDLLIRTKHKLEHEGSRLFVHIKEFTDVLKQNKRSKKKRKRQQNETDAVITPKECKVVLERTSNNFLVDANLENDLCHNNEAKRHKRQSCYLGDGHIVSAEMIRDCTDEDRFNLMFHSVKCSNNGPHSSKTASPSPLSSCNNSSVREHTLDFTSCSDVNPKYISISQPVPVMTILDSDEIIRPFDASMTSELNRYPHLNSKDEPDSVLDGTHEGSSGVLRKNKSIDTCRRGYDEDDSENESIDNETNSKCNDDMNKASSEEYDKVGMLENDDEMEEYSHATIDNAFKRKSCMDSTKNVDDTGRPSPSGIECDDFSTETNGSVSACSISEVQIVSRLEGLNNETGDNNANQESKLCGKDYEIREEATDISVPPNMDNDSGKDDSLGTGEMTLLTDNVEVSPVDRIDADISQDDNITLSNTNCHLEDTDVNDVVDINSVFDSNDQNICPESSEDRTHVLSFSALNEEDNAEAEIKEISYKSNETDEVSNSIGKTLYLDSVCEENYSEELSSQISNKDDKEPSKLTEQSEHFSFPTRSCQGVIIDNTSETILTNTELHSDIKESGTISGKTETGSDVAKKDSVDVKQTRRVPLVTLKDNEAQMSFLGCLSLGSKDSISKDQKSKFNGPSSTSQQGKSQSSAPSTSGPSIKSIEVNSEDEFASDTTSNFQRIVAEANAQGKKAPSERYIKKLENLLENIRDEIEKGRELSLDDMDQEDSFYIYEDKLKKKFVAAWNKLCEITNRTVTTGRPTERKIHYDGTRYKEINRRMEKFLNKKKMFPDFHDVKTIIKLTNKKYNLHLSPQVLNDVSREAFVDIGEMLQTRRHQDFIATFGSQQTDDYSSHLDPAFTDPELRRKLDMNKKIGRSNLDAVINKYTQLQYSGGVADDDDGGDSGEEEEYGKRGKWKEQSKKTKHIMKEDRKKEKKRKKNVSSDEEVDEEIGKLDEMEEIPQGRDDLPCSTKMLIAAEDDPIVQDIDQPMEISDENRLKNDDNDDTDLTTENIMDNSVSNEQSESISSDTDIIQIGPKLKFTKKIFHPPSSLYIDEDEKDSSIDSLAETLTCGFQKINTTPESEDETSESDEEKDGDNSDRGDQDDEDDDLDAVLVVSSDNSDDDDDEDSSSRAQSPISIISLGSASENDEADNSNECEGNGIDLEKDRDDKKTILDKSESKGNKPQTSGMTDAGSESAMTKSLKVPFTSENGLLPLKTETNDIGVKPELRDKSKIPLVDEKLIQMVVEEQVRKSKALSLKTMAGRTIVKKLPPVTPEKVQGVGSVDDAIVILDTPDKVANRKVGIDEDCNGSKQIKKLALEGAGEGASNDVKPRDHSNNKKSGSIQNVDVSGGKDNTDEDDAICVIMEVRTDVGDDHWKHGSDSSFQPSISSNCMQVQEVKGNCEFDAEKGKGGSGICDMQNDEMMVTTVEDVSDVDDNGGSVEVDMQRKNESKHSSTPDVAKINESVEMLENNNTDDRQNKRDTCESLDIIVLSGSVISCVGKADESDSITTEDAGERVLGGITDDCMMSTVAGCSSDRGDGDNGSQVNNSGSMESTFVANFAKSEEDRDAQEGCKKTPMTEDELDACDEEGKDGEKVGSNCETESLIAMSGEEADGEEVENHHNSVSMAEVEDDHIENFKADTIDDTSERENKGGEDEEECGDEDSGKRGDQDEGKCGDEDKGDICRGADEVKVSGNNTTEVTEGAIEKTGYEDCVDDDMANVDDGMHCDGNDEINEAKGKRTDAQEKSPKDEGKDMFNDSSKEDVEFERKKGNKGGELEDSEETEAKRKGEMLTENEINKVDRLKEDGSKSVEDEEGIKEGGVSGRSAQMTIFSLLEGVNGVKEDPISCKEILGNEERDKKRDREMVCDGNGGKTKKLSNCVSRKDENSEEWKVGESEDFEVYVDRGEEEEEEEDVFRSIARLCDSIIQSNEETETDNTKLNEKKGEDGNEMTKETVTDQNSGCCQTKEEEETKVDGEKDEEKEVEDESIKSATGKKSPALNDSHSEEVMDAEDEDDGKFKIVKCKRSKEEDRKLVDELMKDALEVQKSPHRGKRKLDMMDNNEDDTDNDLEITNVEFVPEIKKSKGGHPISQSISNSNNRSMDKNFVMRVDPTGMETVVTHPARRTAVGSRISTNIIDNKGAIQFCAGSGRGQPRLPSVSRGYQHQTHHSQVKGGINQSTKPGGVNWDMIRASLPPFASNTNTKSSSKTAVVHPPHPSNTSSKIRTGPHSFGQHNIPTGSTISYRGGRGNSQGHHFPSHKAHPSTRNIQVATKQYLPYAASQSKQFSTVNQRGNSSIRQRAIPSLGPRVSTPHIPTSHSYTNKTSMTRLNTHQAQGSNMLPRGAHNFNHNVQFKSSTTSPHRVSTHRTTSAKAPTMSPSRARLAERAAYVAGQQKKMDGLVMVLDDSDDEEGESNSGSTEETVNSGSSKSSSPKPGSTVQRLSGSSPKGSPAPGNIPNQSSAVNLKKRSEMNRPNTSPAAGGSTLRKSISPSDKSSSPNQKVSVKKTEGKSVDKSVIILSDSE